jgi:hypothetical protein
MTASHALKSLKIGDFVAKNIEQDLSRLLKNASDSISTTATIREQLKNVLLILILLIPVPQLS